MTTEQRTERQGRSVDERTAERTRLPVKLGPREVLVPAARERTAVPADRRRTERRRPRVRLARPVRLVLQATLGLVLIGLGIMAVLHLMVLSGPVSLGFLVGPLERAISLEFAGAKVRLDDALLRQSEDGRGIEFRISGLRILEPDGDVIAETPLAAISLSASALLRGRLAPVSVDFIKPRLNVAIRRDGGLALAFVRPGEEETPTASVTEPASSGRTGAGSPRGNDAAPATAKAAPTPRAIDVAQVLSRTLAQARTGDAATAYLREIGVRDAVVLVDRSGKRSQWHVPGFTIDLKHQQKRSVVSGEGLISSPAGPWGLSIRTMESQKARRLALAIEFAELNPRALSEQLPDLPALQGLDMPVAGSLQIELTSDGVLRAVEARLSLSPGTLRFGGATQQGILAQGGELRVAYDAQEDRIVVQPSTLQLGGASATVSGALVPQPASTAGAREWRYDLALADARLVARKGESGLAVDRWTLNGAIVPASGRVMLERMQLVAGGAEISMQGHADWLQSTTRFEGTVTAVPLALAIGSWPDGLAPETRAWIAENVSAGRLVKGGFRIVAPSGGVPSSLDLDLEAADIEARLVRGVPPLQTERARIRLQGERLEIAAPQAKMTFASGRSISIREPRFAAANMAEPVPTAEATAQLAATAATLIDVMASEQLDLAKPDGLDASLLEGKVEGQLRLVLPLHAGLSRSEMRIDGRARVSDLKTKASLGAFDLTGGSIQIGLTEKALDAKGDILVGGVPAKVQWQRIFAATADKQPPLRLTATLDTVDRDTLGLAVNHMVQGEVPIVVTVNPDAPGQALVHVEADLGGSELIIENMAWRKPPGRPAKLHTTIARGKDGRTELQNFRIVGDDIAVEGWVAVDARNQLRAFYFPEFTVNVITKLELQGKLRDDNVLEVKAKGPVFDGRGVFRALFSAGQVTDRPLPSPKGRPGLDLMVEIENVIGFHETSLKNVRMSMSRRGDKLVSTQATGLLSGTGATVFAEVKGAQSGARTLHATTPDAGSAFRLVGFYPNVRGGEARLEVNLEGRGHADKTGLLTTRQFALLGDPIVTEVLEGGKKGGQRVVREQIEFDRLRVPFSVGHGQLVLGDSYINGPLLGATMRGKVDYNRQTVFVEGTYVPLYGLNSIPNSIPLLGEILSGGRRGEGLFGITFQVQGAMGNPQVLVNPLSMLTPGFLRQIFETAPGGQSVVPRSEGPAAVPAQSSSSPAISVDSATGPEAAQDPRASSLAPQRSVPGADAPRPEAPPRRSAPQPRDSLHPDARSGS